MLSKQLNQQILRSVFRIHPGEGLRVVLMFLYSITVVGGVVITSNMVSRALFLGTLPSSAVPFKFILPPIFLTPVILIYTRVAPRFRRDQLIIASNVLILLVVLSFRLLLETRYERHFVVVSALFVCFDTINNLVMIQFWTFAGDIFNSREAKRLFNLIAGGGTIATILFGGALSSVATKVAPKDLIFVMVISLLCCTLCVRFIGRKYREMLSSDGTTPQEEPPPEKSRIIENFREVLRVPLVLSMSGILIILALVSSIANYQLDLGLQSKYGDNSQGMVEFLGNFFFWTGIVAGLLSFFLANRLLERFGTLGALLLLPSFIGFSSTAILLTGGLFWVVILPRASNLVLKYAINDPAFNLLYLPVNPLLRAKAKAILDGIIVPPAICLIGVSFLLARQIEGFTIVQWSLPMIALVAIWIFFIIRVCRQYVSALSDNIRLRSFDPDAEIMNVSEESIKVVINTLQHSDSMQVLHALSLLPQIPDVDWNPYVAALLSHKSTDVRVLAIEYLGEHGTKTHADGIRKQLSHPEERVRAAAIMTLCALESQQVISEVRPFLSDSSPHIRAAAVIGFIKHCGLDGLLHAVEQLKALLGSPEPKERLEAARVLAVLQVPSFYQPLIDLLEDEITEVQIAAIRAAAKIRAPELIPYLFGKLSYPRTRPDATVAIAQCTRENLSVLEEILRDEAQPIVVRRQLTHILQQQSSAQAVRILSKSFDDSDDSYRVEAYQALLNLRADGHQLPISNTRLREVLTKEFHIAYALFVQRQDIVEGTKTNGTGEKPPRSDMLLFEALEKQIQQAEDRILSLIAILYPDLPIGAVRESLAKDDSRLRATAIELIDNVADSKVKEFLLPLIGSSHNERLHVAQRKLDIENQSVTDRLDKLARSKDNWLRSCALYSIGEHKFSELVPTVEASLLAEEPLVRESALVASRNLYSSERFREQLKVQISSDSFPEEIVPYTEKLLTFDQKGDHQMALSTIEKVLFLKSAPLFEDISGEEIVGMVPIVEEVRFDPDQTFIKQGSEGDCLYIIVSGQVAIKIDGEQKAVLKARDIIGEMAVLSSQPRTADCTALTDIIALKIDKADFWKLMSELPEIAIGVMKVLVSRYL